MSRQGHGWTFTGAERRAPEHCHRHLSKESVVALSEGVTSRAVLKFQVHDARAPGYEFADVDRLVVFGVTLLEGGAPFCVLIRGEAKTNAVLFEAAMYPRAGLHASSMYRSIRMGIAGPEHRGTRTTLSKVAIYDSITLAMRTLAAVLSRYLQVGGPAWRWTSRRKLA